MKTKVASLISLLILASAAFAQSGGPFTITKSVIAGGGGTSSGGTFTLDGTIGQAAAGTTSTGGNFSLTGGFWGGTAAPVTAVSISGRVTTPAGLNLRNVIVSLIDQNGLRRTATTSSFGLYSFDAVSTGQTYTMIVTSKRYRFTPQFVSVTGSLTNIDFVGLE
jgi:hypothetical protein